MVEFDLLTEAVRDVILTDELDSWRWILETSGVFSVKSLRS